jgi:myo-inositol-1(or 4)-monophosphatase
MHPKLNLAIDAVRYTAKMLLRAFIHGQIPIEELESMLHERLTRTQITWLTDIVGNLSNYQRGIPHLAISVAAIEAEQVRFAIIYEPFLDELFVASKGEGSLLNSKRIRIHDKIVEPKLIVSTTQHPHQSIPAIELAYVAANRIDGFYGTMLPIAVSAAGSLLVREAGGLLSNLQGNDLVYTQQTQGIIAAKPKLLPTLITELRHQ